MDGITCLEENTERDQRALAVGVHRACFLCGNTKGEQLFEENWEVVSIGSIRIGVRICSECGLVLQDPVAPPSVMFRYYEQLSNYRNPGRSGLPSKDRITAVDRQLAVLNRYVKVQGRALQVGCADGYTLHRFKQAGWSVAGVDPSPAAAEVAKTLWGLRTDVGFFEDYRPQGNSPYDLIILTHVLEHIYDL